MARNRKKRHNNPQLAPVNDQAVTETVITPGNTGCVEFSLGDPEPVMGSSLLDSLGTFFHGTGQYYEPPLSLTGLSRMRHASPHHGSAIAFKRNQLAKHFVESTAISMADFRAAALDLEVAGNGYFQQYTDYLGNVTRLVHRPMLNMRKMKDTEAGESRYMQLGKNNNHTYFEPGEILHIKDYDTGQQLYGVPEWLCGMQSVLLNEDATLFRRRYFANGCHIGYILYTSDPCLDPKIETAIRDKIKQGKGVGNFKSVYINIPNGKEKSVQIIPVGDISQKDEFEKIKNITADDVIVAHRLHPALAGLKPDNAGGFGDIEKINKVYVENEIKPKAHPFQEINRLLPQHARFTFNFPSDT